MRHLQQGQELGDVVLGGHGVDDPVKGIGNSLRTCQNKVRSPSIPKGIISSDNVAPVVEQLSQSTGLSGSAAGSNAAGSKAAA